MIDNREQKQLLQKCAATTLSSKLVSAQKDFFSHMVVTAVSILDENLPMDMIGIKKVQGGALEVRVLSPRPIFIKLLSRKYC